MVRPLKMGLAVVLALCLLFLGAGAGAMPPAVGQGGEGAAAGELLVRFQPGVAAADQARAHSAAGARLKGVVPGVGALLVSVTPGRAAAALEAYANNPNVMYAEENSWVATYADPSDPYYASPYNTSHAGPVSQWDLARVNIPWDTLREATGTAVVAVVDSGVAPDHPDLAGRLVGGWNTQNNSTDTRDDNGHGTHVAGTVAGLTDNGLGVASLGHHLLQVMPVKVLDATGSGTLYDVALGIVWAADHGAHVINLSLGTTMYSQTLQDAVTYAWHRGVFVAAAAGNAGRRQLTYPAANWGALGVGATDPADLMAGFSSFGAHVGVSAPGVNILSTMPGYPVHYTAQNGYLQDYDAMSGTSMATPHVAALAGVLKALNPAMSPAGLYHRIQSTAVGIMGTAGGGWDERSGYGRIDVAAAIAGTPRPAAVGGIVGQAVRPGGTAIANARVCVGNDCQNTGKDGKFRFANRAPGDYTVQVTSRKYGNGQAAVTVQAGSDALVQVQAGG